MISDVSAVSQIKYAGIAKQDSGFVCQAAKALKGLLSCRAERSPPLDFAVRRVTQGRATKILSSYVGHYSWKVDRQGNEMIIEAIDYDP